MKKYCTVLYEGWQMQCCGQPFSIDDMVKWDVFVLNKTLITNILQTKKQNEKYHRVIAKGTNKNG